MKLKASENNSGGWELTLFNSLNYLLSFFDVSKYSGVQSVTSLIACMFIGGLGILDR